MTAMTKLGIALLTLAGFGLGVASAAAADNQEYLADISTQGIPVSDVNRDSLLRIGQETYSTARQHPSMQITDLALTIAHQKTAYPYDKARIIVTSALDNLCPDAKK
jgi:hypothetical protein